MYLLDYENFPELKDLIKVEEDAIFYYFLAKEAGIEVKLTPVSWKWNGN